MTRRTPRGAAAVLAIALAAGPAARAQTFKSAHWISRVEIDSGARAGGAMPGDYEIWWKEGKTRMKVVIGGIAVHMLKIGDELYTWAEGQTTGMKVSWSASQDGKRPNSDYVNRIEEFRAKGKKVGAETIEGHPCEVWEYRDPSGTQGKYWLAQHLKSFPIKAEMDIGAGKITYRNRDIEIPGSVPESIFAPPENLGFQDISQGMNRGGRTPTVKPTAFPVGPLPRWTPTRTPTKVLGAMEVTPTAPEVTVRETPVPDKGCLDRADGSLGVGQPCLQGTYFIQHDVTETPNPRRTQHVVAPMRVEFSLWAVKPGTLQGTAHLTYSVRGTLVDTEAKGCKVQTEVVEPFSWDVQLAGQFFTRPDGSFQVIAQATPGAGPSFKEKFEDCPIPERVARGVTWAGVRGALANGVCDVRQDLPLPANSTGESYALIHIEQVDRP